ncbi:MAG: Bax inhibitor-1/YccA family protein [Proteobacteria bacterium]|nr:Bax inhibitor-1/YccA family protein [Pseudomonadota bacterium]
MSDYNNPRPWGGIPAPADMALDQGLRSFMLGVYNKLALGLGLAAAIAWVVGNVPEVSHLLFRYLGAQPVGYTPLGWVVAFAPLIIILFSNFFMRGMTAVGSAVFYWVLVSLIGASLGVLFLVYTGAQILSAFAITAAAFGGLSLVGYTIKRSLSGMGSFLIMGVWGLVITSLVTMFVPGLYSNPVFFFAYNIIGVLLFSGLIAYKTQDLKLTYYTVRGDGATMAVATNMGALSLFISFVNLFQFIVALLGGGGGRRN